MVLRLVSDLPENNQSSFDSSSPATIKELERLGFLDFRAFAPSLEYEYHEPDVFGVVTLPALRVA